jgi:hypothetical protein
MKVMWKGVSRIGDGDEALLVVTLRQEYEMVVDQKQIQRFTDALKQLVERQVILPDLGRTWELEFEVIRALLSQIKDSPPAVKGAALATPWKEWPAESINDILPALKNAFCQGAFFSLKGVVPSYTMVYHFATSTKEFPLLPVELEPTKDYFSRITEPMLVSAANDVRAQRSTATDAAVAIGVAVGATVITVGAVYGAAVGIGLIATGAVTAGQVMTFINAAAAVVGAAAAARQCQLQEQEAERKRQEQEAQKQRADKEKADREAKGVREVAGGGPAWEKGMGRGGMVA